MGKYIVASANKCIKILIANYKKLMSEPHQPLMRGNAQTANEDE